MTESFQFHVGTYTRGASPRSEGIYRLEIQAFDGSFGACFCVAKCDDPSYLVRSSDRKTLYAVSEKPAEEDASVLAFRCADDGGLVQLSRVPVSGGAPCHLSLSSGGRFLASAQYATGDIHLFSVAPGGDLNAQVAMARVSGSGPNSARQKGPHAHCVGFFASPAQLSVVDLGIDAILIYALNSETGLDAEPVQRLALPPGSGPRHMVATHDGTTIYVFGELEETIYIIRRDKGIWALQDSACAFDRPNGHDGSGAAIRLSPDERHLYVSSRTTSEIACFCLQTDLPTLVQKVSTGGKTPRDFAISPDGNFIVVANQDSGTIRSFARDQESGQLENTGFCAEVGSPVCVLF